MSYIHAVHVIHVIYVIHVVHATDVVSLRRALPLAAAASSHHTGGAELRVEVPVRIG